MLSRRFELDVASIEFLDPSRNEARVLLVPASKRLRTRSAKSAASFSMSPQEGILRLSQAEGGEAACAGRDSRSTIVT
jgi:hypothetical protein